MEYSSSNDVLKDLQVHEQMAVNRDFLVRLLVTHDEINEHGAVARGLLDSLPLSLAGDVVALAANGFPFEIRCLHAATQFARGKQVESFEPFVRALFSSLSAVKLKRAPVVLIDEDVDECATSLGSLRDPCFAAAMPSESARQLVVPRIELVLRCRDDVERALRLIASGEPSEEAILLLTALILELSGEMEPPASDADNPDTTRIERARKAIGRARKRRASLDRQPRA